MLMLIASPLNDRSSGPNASNNTIKGMRIPRGRSLDIIWGRGLIAFVVL